MFRKEMFFIICFFVEISIVYGGQLTCPSTNDIRLGHFHEWLPLNANSNSLVTLKMMKKFLSHIEDFYLAEYFEDGPYTGHCYYGGFQEVYLAKEGLSEPKVKQGNWYQMGERWRCQSSSVKECPFNHD